MNRMIIIRTEEMTGENDSYNKDNKNDNDNNNNKNQENKTITNEENK